MVKSIWPRPSSACALIGWLDIWALLLRTARGSGLDCDETSGLIAAHLETCGIVTHGFTVSCDPSLPIRGFHPLQSH